MKKKKSLAQLLSTGNTRAPVEQTVLDEWENILASVANGWSFSDIADALRNEGKNAGNLANTGFSQAVGRVARRKGVDLSEVRLGGRHGSSALTANGDQNRLSTPDDVDLVSGAPAQQPSEGSTRLSPESDYPDYSSDF